MNHDDAAELLAALLKSRQPNEDTPDGTLEQWLEVIRRYVSGLPNPARRKVLWQVLEGERFRELLEWVENQAIHDKAADIANQDFHDLMSQMRPGPSMN